MKISNNPTDYILIKAEILDDYTIISHLLIEIKPDILKQIKKDHESILRSDLRVWTSYSYPYITALNIDEDLFPEFFENNITYITKPEDSVNKIHEELNISYPKLKFYKHDLNFWIEAYYNDSNIIVESSEELSCGRIGRRKVSMIGKSKP